MCFCQRQSSDRAIYCRCSAWRSRSSARCEAAFSGPMSSSIITHTRPGSTLSYSCRRKFPRARTLGHGTVGHSSLASSPSFFAASLIRYKHRSVALRVFRSSRKAARSIPFVNSSMRAMFSRISTKRWIGSLEGMNRLGLNVLPYPRLERAFLNEFHCPVQHPRNLPLDCHDRQD